MGLQSQLLHGDPKLEAAAVSDPAHIVPGAKGPHVKKIQSALNQVDGAAIDTDGVYGPATAAAVLAYKTRRRIINPSRQTRADDIIGKLTMAALDLELLILQRRPVLLRPHFPGPASAGGSARPPVLAMGGGERSAIRPVLPPSSATQPGPRAPAPVVAEVFIEPRGSGTIKMTGGRGGKLVRFQDTRFVGAIVALREATTPGDGCEEADVTSDPQLFSYVGQGNCGESHFQWFGPEAVPRRSGVVTVFALVRKSTYKQHDVYPVDNAFKSGLVSVQGTPLKPRPGKRINIFGRGESNGFDDYSSGTQFCLDSNSNYKPWTNDPRKPEVGLEDRSVANVCIRDSPIEQVTIDEIKRIGAPGCRVTYSTDPNSPRHIALLQRVFIATGLARHIDGGVGSRYQAIVFELN